MARKVGNILFVCFVISLLVLSISCSKEDRHRLLTTFFDGVPSLEGQLGAEGRSRSTKRYRHEAAIKKEDCKNCHPRRRETSGFDATINLIMEFPDLCYQCHDAFDRGRYVHGPVAAGECVFCHDPHDAPNKSLLIKLAPELCYGCHEEKVIMSIKDHDLDGYLSCTKCHNPHESSKKHLLRETRIEGIE